MFWSTETIQLTPYQILPGTGVRHMSTYIVTPRVPVSVSNTFLAGTTVYQYLTRVVCKRNDSVQS